MDGDRAAKVNLVAALALFDGHWKPERVATVNDYEVKLAKVRGEFVRHVHADTDELFLVVHGRLTIRMDAGDVTLEPGELYVVPRGVPHQPYAETETHIMLLEPAGVVNTGDVGGEFTAAVEPL